MCYFNIQLPKLPANCHILGGPDPELYVVQLLSGTIVIKALPSGPPISIQHVKMRRKPMIAVKDNIISKLILDDHDFSINQGCVLYVIDPEKWMP